MKEVVPAPLVLSKEEVAQPWLPYMVKVRNARFESAAARMLGTLGSCTVPAQCCTLFILFPFIMG